MLLTFESLDLKSSFVVCRYIFWIFRLSLYIKVIEVKLKVTGAKNVKSHLATPSVTDMVQSSNCGDGKSISIIWGMTLLSASTRVAVGTCVQTSNFQPTRRPCNDRLCLCILFAGCLPLLERHSCLVVNSILSYFSFSCTVSGCLDV